MPFLGRTYFRLKGVENTKNLMEVEVVRTKITLACTECKNRNYNTTKDKKAHPDRMETKSIVDSVRLIHYTRKPNSLAG